MKLLVLASAGGDAHRRTLAALVANAAREHDVRVLAPDAEGKVLRAAGVAVESWNPAGLFSVLRSVGALHRAAERHEPEVVHAVGWAAAAVALGALTAAQSARTVVTLVDPIRDGEIPKPFVEKRLPELLRRAGHTTVAYPSLARMLTDELGVERGRVEHVPYGVAPQLPPAAARPPQRPGPVVGYLTPLDHDDAWTTAVGAIAFVARALPQARLALRAGAERARLVRAFARSTGAEGEMLCEDGAGAAGFLPALDLVLVPRGRDGLPYALPEALVDGIPVVAADDGALAETLLPYETGWLVPEHAGGLAAGIEAAWSRIDAAWAGAQAQRARAAAAYDPNAVATRVLASYARAAGIAS